MTISKLIALAAMFYFGQIYGGREVPSRFQNEARIKNLSLRFKNLVSR